MSQRDDLMQQFGPLLIEALALTVLDDINLLRGELGLSPRTPQHLLDQLNNHLSTLPDYDWPSPEV